MTSQPVGVGFIGLGIMGSAMAGNILKAGFSLTVYNRTPGRCDALRQAGAAVAASPAELAAACDVIVSCVTDSDDVLEVILGRHAFPQTAREGMAPDLAREGMAPVIAGVRSGAIVIDCSTVSPAVARQCGAALAAKGAGFLDAPVSGGDVGAKAGTLSIMVGGEKSHFERALPVLKAMGKTITHCGPAGSGYVVKLCNQVLVAMNLLGVAEMLSLAQAAGIDPTVAISALAGGAAASWSLVNLGPKIVAGDNRPGFFVDYLLKDLGIAARTADDLKLTLLVTPVATAVFRAASTSGHGRDGTQSIHEVYKTLRGKS